MCVCVRVCVSACVREGGGGRKEGRSGAALKTKTPHVNVGNQLPHTIEDSVKVCRKDFRTVLVQHGGRDWGVPAASLRVPSPKGGWLPRFNREPKAG